MGGLTNAEEPERQPSSPTVTTPWVLDLKVRLVVPKNGTGGGSPQPAQAANGPEKLPIPRVAIVAQV